MSAPFTLSTSIPAWLAFALLVGGASGRTAPQPPAPAATETASGTIHHVDVEGRALELLTGVGHALRLLPMKVAGDCDVQVEGRPASLSDLRRGQIVHVRFAAVGDQHVARAIETVALEASGGER